MMESSNQSDNSSLMRRRPSSKLHLPGRNDNWAIPEPSMPQFPSTFESILNPRELYEKMLLPTECDLIKDRRYHFRTYKKCFVANEMVDWFIAQSNGLWSREQAVRFGQLLRRIGCISHVVDEHDFADDFLFFKVNILRKKNSRIIDRPKEVILAQYTLEEVVQRVQDPERGFLVKDRYFHLKKYEEVFVASEAVDWLMKNLHLRNRAEAVIWGRYLQSEGILDHCVSEWPFLDQFLFFKFTSYFPSKSSTADATVDIDISSSSSSEDDFSVAGNRRISRGSVSELRESFSTAAALSPAQIAAKEKEFSEAYDSVMHKQKKSVFKAFRLPGIPAYLMRREYSFSNARLLGYGYVAAFYNRCGSMVISNFIDGRMIRINNAVPVRGCAISWPWVATLHGTSHIQFYNVVMNRVSVFHSKSSIEAVLLETPTIVGGESKLAGSSPRVVIVGHDRVIIQEIASMTKTLSDGEQPTDPRVIVFQDLEDLPENFKPSPALCAMCQRYIVIGNQTTLRVFSLRSGRQKLAISAGASIPDVLSFTTATMTRGKLVVSTVDRLIVWDIYASRKKNQATPSVTEALLLTAVRVGDKYIETGNAAGRFELRDPFGKLILASADEEDKRESPYSSANSSPSASPKVSPRGGPSSNSSPTSPPDPSYRRSASIVEVMKTRINTIASTKSGWICGHENNMISLWQLQTDKSNSSSKLVCTDVFKQNGPVRDIGVTDGNAVFAILFPGLAPGESTRKMSTRNLVSSTDENESSGSPLGKKGKSSGVVEIAVMRI